MRAPLPRRQRRARLRQPNHRTHKTLTHTHTVSGVLKGYDQLLNMVLDEAVEYLRGACVRAHAHARVWMARVRVLHCAAQRAFCCVHGISSRARALSRRALSHSTHTAAHTQPHTTAHNHHHRPQRPDDRDGRDARARPAGACVCVPSGRVLLCGCARVRSLSLARARRASLPTKRASRTNKPPSDKQTRCAAARRTRSWRRRRAARRLPTRSCRRPTTRAASRRRRRRRNETRPHAV